MNDQTVKKKQATPEEPRTHKQRPSEKQPWERPEMEDVSDEVMAQPYIRFT